MTPARRIHGMKTCRLFTASRIEIPQYMPLIESLIADAEKSGK